MDNGDIYTDDEPGYRATRLNSGIPPPSSAGFYNRSRMGDHDQRNRHSASSTTHRQGPSRERHDIPLKTPDIRVYADYMICGSDKTSKQLDLKELVKAIQPSPTSDSGDLFGSRDLFSKVRDWQRKSQRHSPDRWARALVKSSSLGNMDTSIFLDPVSLTFGALDTTFGFTQPTNRETGSALFSFVDIGDTTGGAVDYLQWRLDRQERTIRGYGIALRSDSSSYDKNRSRYTKIEGGTDNVYNREKLDRLGEAVHEGTQSQGVDLVIANGSDSEKLSPQLLICETIAMLKTMRKGGTFACRFFDTSLPFVIDLIWLLYQLFEKVNITKPPTIHPSQSDRYAICKGFRFFNPTILIDALFSLEDKLSSENASRSDQKEHIQRFVAPEYLKGDEEFTDYVKMRNVQIAMKQIESLELTETFVLDSHRPPVYDHLKAQSQCWANWKLPQHRHDRSRPWEDTK